MKLDNQQGYLYYRVFQFMWLVFLIFHFTLVSSELLLERGFLIQGLHVLLFGSIFLSLWKPDKIGFFAMSLLSFIAIKVIIMPYIPNHFILAIIIALTLLAGIPLCWDRSLELKERLGYWFKRVMPPVMAMLIIVYLFAVFHKLNDDFFNTSVSCGSDLYLKIATRYPIPFPEGEWMQWIAIVGALLLELIIPVLLIMPTTRLLGVLVGILFHILLALHSNLAILSFSSEVYALYILFLPPGLVKSIFERGVSLAKNPAVRRVFGFGLGGFLIGAGVFLFLFEPLFSGYEGELSEPSRRLRYVTVFAQLFIWFPWVFFLLGNYYDLVKSELFAPSESLTLWTKSPSILWVFTLAVFLNGWTPYFGLKTTLNYSMFSNLRVEGPLNNHWFMFSNFQVADYQTDVVEILETSHEGLQYYKDTNQKMLYFELRRFIGKIKEDETFQLTYRRNGEVHKVSLPDDWGLEVTQAPSLLERKLLLFRTVPEPGPCPCRW